MKKRGIRMMIFVCMLACVLCCTGCSPFELGKKVGEIMCGDTSDDDYSESDYVEEDSDYDVDGYEMDEDYDVDEEDFDVDDYDVDEEDDFDVDDYEDYEEDYADSSDSLAVPESVITDYNWKAYHDGSLIVCETDCTFRYYQSEEDMTDDYFEGTYEFYVGAEAVEYVTTVLSEFDVTEEELEGLFERSEEHDESILYVWCFTMRLAL